MLLRPRLWLMLLLALLGLLQYRLWMGDGGIPSVHKLQAKVALEQAKVQRVKARNNAMKAEVEDLKKGNAAIGGWARSELGMVKKGERFFLLVHKPGVADAGGHATTSAPQ